MSQATRFICDCCLKEFPDRSPGWALLDVLLKKADRPSFSRTDSNLVPVDLCPDCQERVTVQSLLALARAINEDKRA